MILIALGLLLFLLLVVLHELGHFWAARRSGVEVEEFGVGFPPRLFGWRSKKSDVLYSVNLLPLGGFVKLKGESDADRRSGSFGAASLSRKAKILLAGVAMNLLIAIVLITILAWIGLPKAFDDQFTIASDERSQRTTLVIAHVSPDSAAASAGVQPGDLLLSINDEVFADEEAVFNFTTARPNQPVTLRLERDGQPLELPVVIATRDDGTGILGIQPLGISSVRYSWSAPLVGIGVTVQGAIETVKAFGSFIGSLLLHGLRDVDEQPVAGPIGIFVVIRSLSELGLVNYLLFLMAMISVSLATINLMPIPALDGGRLALIAAFRLLKRPLTEKTEALINNIGFLLLIGLIVLITVIDVGRLR